MMKTARSARGSPSEPRRNDRRRAPLALARDPRRAPRRGVIRTGNAPAGDYAELLVQRATGGELAPNSQKSWDVLKSDGERLQIKARVVTDPRKRGERQLSVFRSWQFDAAVVVLFDDEFRVWRAARLCRSRPAHCAPARSSPSTHGSAAARVDVGATPACVAA